MKTTLHNVTRALGDTDTPYLVHRALEPEVEDHSIGLTNRPRWSVQVHLQGFYCGISHTEGEGDEMAITFYGPYNTVEELTHELGSHQLVGV